MRHDRRSTVTMTVSPPLCLRPGYFALGGYSFWGGEISRWPPPSSWAPSWLGASLMCVAFLAERNVKGLGLVGYLLPFAFGHMSYSIRMAGKPRVLLGRTLCCLSIVTMIREECMTILSRIRHVSLGCILFTCIAK